MKIDIKKAVEELTPYHALIGMLIFFGGIFIWLYNIIIAPSDLKVSVTTEAVVYPRSISESFGKVNDYLSDKDTLVVESFGIYEFLLKTTDIKRIILRNTSSKTLKNVNFKHLNTKNLSAFSITSSFLTSDEQNYLYDNLILDDKREIIYFQNPIDLPPNKEVIINIWGSFTESPVNQNILVTYDDGDGFFENDYYVSGFQGYVYKNTFQFFFMAIIIFCGVYYFGIKNAKKQSE
ncbi:hypothetical protein [Zunongwangia sp. HRR-M8]|uniref:hypothetical protein n=1 Tax=Zunongwangia sp. HRR-M8 TaxID=3015170 RepID=UPI0022DDB65C|nr:hypothetical protein [Zunongwangia sp. HRR-M8]WBL22705.1 hypothetical protein PBT89_01805 [Zunongwangia sp. HRR-M8]